MSDRASALLIAACLGVSFLLPAVTLDDRGLVAFYHDDAFYYFQVARNVLAGHGFTFDGLHATNGFHPLWLFVVAPVFAVVDGLVAPLRAIGFLQAALLAAAGAVLFSTLASRIGRAPAAVAALALGATPGARAILWSGLESSLLLILLILIWNRALSLPDEPGRSHDVLGILCALALAARLEAILVLPALLLAFPAIRSRRGAIVRVAAPCLAMLTAMLAFNRIGFGTWLPISGLVKAQWARMSEGSWVDAFLSFPWVGREMACRAFGAGDVRLCPGNGVVLSLVLEALLLALLLFQRSRLIQAVRSSGLLFLILASALIVGADLAAVTYLAPWYRAPILLCTALAASLMLHPFPRTATAIVFLLAAGMLAHTSMLIVAPRDLMTQYAFWRVETAEWLRATTGEDERIGSWNAGMLGYFSGRSVVNLDGLVNDLDYFRRVTVGRDLDGYLRSEEIGWLADQTCGRDPSLEVFLRRTGSEHLAGRLSLKRAFYNEATPDQCPGFSVWRVRVE